jgi:hypothetical protein
MPIDAEFEAAVAAIRSIRVKGAQVHDEVVHAYARAAVEAAERARLEDFQRRSRLANKATEEAETPRPDTVPVIVSPPQEFAAPNPPRSAG